MKEQNQLMDAVGFMTSALLETQGVLAFINKHKGSEVLKEQAFINVLASTKMEIIEKLSFALQSLSGNAKYVADIKSEVVVNPNGSLSNNIEITSTKD